MHISDMLAAPHEFRPNRQGTCCPNCQQTAFQDSGRSTRHSDPIEQARAILFLASPASAYITGHHLPVDGGYHVG